LRVRWYGRPAVSGDEEDVANAALCSVILRLRQGNYPGITDHNGMWRLLACFAVRKAGRLVKRWHTHPPVQSLSSVNEVRDPSRSPSSRVASADDLERLLYALSAYRPAKSQHPQGEELVQLVRLLADGHDMPQIADRLGVARCTVYRWLELVRRLAAERGIVIEIDESAPTNHRVCS
jgi:hypothetical protein